MRFKYTAEQVEFLRAGFLLAGIPELTRDFNARFGLDKSCTSIRAALKNRRITCGRKTGEILKGKSLLFTPDQAAFVRENLPGRSRAELTDLLNETFAASFTVSQVTAFTKNHKIRSGRNGRFIKGRLSWNKGTKGLTGRNQTCFVAGDVPVNRKPLGSERIDAKSGHILVKIAEENPYTGHGTRYKHKHVHIWELLHGPAPKGKVVFFVDGDKLNCSPENLMLIERSVLLRLNQSGYRALPGVLKPTLLAVVKIEVKAFEKRRNFRV
ncbi:MAG TPA: HNH endonuclease [Syntrophaceae bacterium]|jgi:hypothetical protein|nr:HNH endonuclease [Syntrophaceae bacterium]